MEKTAAFPTGGKQVLTMEQVKQSQIGILFIPLFHKLLPPAGFTYPCFRSPHRYWSRNPSNDGEAAQVWGRPPSGAQPPTSLTTRRGPPPSQVGAPSSPLLRSALELGFERKPEALTAGKAFQSKICGENFPLLQMKN